ncbi:MAG: class I SAM-dependent methyltransferase [Acidimicrobiia bacterium]|nr:class I SAM-dependent methyltransferase [Acidimicrobiia bacterium]
MTNRYTASAEIYDKIYAEVVDYPASAGLLKWLIAERNPETKTLLEVACGTGEVLRHLADEYVVAGLDLSEDMLDVARVKLPNVELRALDMTDFEWGATFDAVICMFSSIGYMTDLDSLHGAYDRMIAHLNPGGVLVCEAWLTPEAFQDNFVGGLAVGDHTFRVHRVNNSWLEDDGRVSVMDMHHLVGRPEGVTHFAERHRMGLFTVDEHLEAIRATGIEAEHRPDLFMGRGTYIGAKA